MAFNLIREAWIPVRRAKGALEWIAPWEVTDPGPGGDDFFVSIDAARPDFNGGLIQFLIGLVQTALPPQREKDWILAYKNPPSPETLKTEFGKYAHAFNLDGDYPRFMQDMGELGKAKEFEVTRLLIDSPGDNTVKNNVDFFIKRDSGGGVCPACLAAALFIRQSLGPGYGAGYRNSLRTGGPMTTIIQGDSLWRTVWFNVLGREYFIKRMGNQDLRNEEDKFPWLKPAKTSENGQEIFPQHVAAEQVYWSMAQRIRLDPVGEEGVCSVCNRPDLPLFSSFKAKNLGPNYHVGNWLHPLNPTYLNKEDTFFLKARSGGINYRHWVGLVQPSSDGSRDPAPVVDYYSSTRSGLVNQLNGGQQIMRLGAFGFDMDNAKAKAWVEGQMPILVLPEGHRQVFQEIVESMISGAGLAVWAVGLAIKNAWYMEGDDRRKKSLPDVEARFWADTEPHFYDTVLSKLKSLVENGQVEFGSPAERELKLEWLKILRLAGLAIFDDLAQVGQIGQADPKRIARARNQLKDMLLGRDKKKLILTVKPPPMAARPEKVKPFRDCQRVKKSSS